MTFFSFYARNRGKKRVYISKHRKLWTVFISCKETYFLKMSRVAGMRYFLWVPSELYTQDSPDPRDYM